MQHATGLLRYAGRAAAAGAGVGAAAATTHYTGQCYSARPGLRLPSNRAPDEASDAGSNLGAGWLLADVSRDNHVYIESDDVEQCVFEILHSSKSASVSTPSHDVESVASTDSHSSQDEQANSWIEAAGRRSSMDSNPTDMALSVCNAGSDVTAMIMSLLNNPAVVGSITDHLKSDPQFRHFMHDPPNMERYLPTVVIEDITEAHASQGARRRPTAQTGKNPLEAIGDALGAGFVHIGETMKQAGEEVGRFFVSLGHKLRRSFEQAQAAAPGRAAPGMQKREAAWVAALTTLAVAVFAMLVSKGKVKLHVPVRA